MDCLPGEVLDFCCSQAPTCLLLEDTLVSQTHKDFAEQSRFSQLSLRMNMCICVSEGLELGRSVTSNSPLLCLGLT